MAPTKRAPIPGSSPANPPVLDNWRLTPTREGRTIIDGLLTDKSRKMKRRQVEFYPVVIALDMKSFRYEDSVILLGKRGPWE